MNELENNPSESPELSQPAPEQAPDTTNEHEPQTDQADEIEQDGEQAAEPELEEVEIDGIKLAIPKDASQKVREALLRQADYTRKTQELAQQREQFEQTRAQREARIEAERANIQAVARIVAVDERLQQYANVDWQALSQSDPVRAQQEFFTYQQLKDSRGALVQQIQQHEAQRALQEQESTSRSLQQANEVLGREIKGWSPEYAKELRNVAKSLGADEKDLDGIRAPWIVRALHAEKVLREMTSKATKAPAPAPAQPVKTITGGSARGAVDSDKLGIDEWMRREQARAARLGRRY